MGGKDRFLYRAVDKEGNTVDFLLTKRRQKMSAQIFFNKAIGNNGKPRIVNIDKSGANKTALWAVNKRSFSVKKIKIRQCKYLNNIVEQDHRNVKRRIVLISIAQFVQSASKPNGPITNKSKPLIKIVN